MGKTVQANSPGGNVLLGQKTPQAVHSGTSGWEGKGAGGNMLRQGKGDG